jgi:hypothetical protein
VEIMEVDKARLPASVLFDVLYTTDDGTKEHAYAPLAIKLTDAGQQKPIEISVHGTFDSIATNRPGLGYLLVTNNLDVPVNITRIDILLPSSLELPGNKKPDPFIVPPRSAMRQTIELDAAASVSPGKYSVPFELQAEWDALGHHESRSLVVNQDVTVGVFFESEILRALGVPSFLLLPGCLFIFTMQLLLAFGLFGLTNDSKVPDLPLTSPGFWILSVTYSSGFAVAYRYFTGADYLVRYGAADLMRVWLSSIGIGVMFYVIVALIVTSLRKNRVPRATDDQITILRKMSKHARKVVNGVVTFILNGVDLRGYPVERIEDGQTLVWVASKIVTQWDPAAAAQTARGNFETQINNRDSLDVLAGSLEEARGQGWVQIRWNTEDSIPDPYHLKIESITSYLPQEVIIEVS